jgi:hypothetical protein
MGKNKDGKLLCHLCDEEEIIWKCDPEENEYITQLEYRILDNKIVPWFGISTLDKMLHTIPEQTMMTMQLAMDHDPYGTTDGKQDYSKAVLCTMLCISCNNDLGIFEKEIERSGSLNYFKGKIKYQQQYTARMETYIEDKKNNQRAINHWVKGIDRDDDCYAEILRRVKNLYHKKNGERFSTITKRKRITEELERLGKNIEGNEKSRTKIQSWVGLTKGMTNRNSITKRSLFSSMPPNRHDAWRNASQWHLKRSLFSSMPPNRHDAWRNASQWHL